MGCERDTGNGETDELTLAAAQAPHRVAHQQERPEVIAAQTGSPESLAYAELATDRDSTSLLAVVLLFIGAKGLSHKLRLFLRLPILSHVAHPSLNPFPV